VTGMTEDEHERARRIARQAVRLPVEGRVLVVMALLEGDQHLNEVDPGQLKTEQHSRIRSYRGAWCAELSGNGAARQIERDLQTYAAGEWRQHQYCSAPPESMDPRRRALFDILKCGLAPRYEALRKIVRG
jgi:hypothetical protein